MAKKSKTDEIVKTEEVSTNLPTPAEEPLKEQGTVGIGEGVAWSLSIDRQSVQDAIELFAAEVGLAKDVGPLLESHPELFDSIVNAIKFAGDPTTAAKQAGRDEAILPGTENLYQYPELARLLLSIREINEHCSIDGPIMLVEEFRTSLRELSAKVNEKATETTPKAGLLEVLGELAGSSSMCWDPRPTGVFDATRAKEFAEDAARRIMAPREPDDQKYEELVTASEIILRRITLTGDGEDKAALERFLTAVKMVGGHVPSKIKSVPQTDEKATSPGDSMTAGQKLVRACKAILEGNEDPAYDELKAMVALCERTEEPSASGTPTHVFYAVKYQRDWLLHATEKLAECVVLSRSNPGGVDSAAFDDAIDKVQVICTKIRDGVPILAGDAGLVVPSPAAIGSPEDRVEVASWRAGAPMPKPQFMTTKPEFGIDAAHPGEDRGFFPENATKKPRTPATLIAIVPLNDWKNIRENSALAQKFGHLYRVHVCHDGESTDQAMQHERERGMDPHLWTSDIFE